MSLIVVEKFLGPDFVDFEDKEAFVDFKMTLEVLSSIELEKDPFTNLLKHDIRKHAALLTHLIDANTTVRYPEGTRPRWEVRIGYKEATRRGANLFEVDVFNVLFHFYGGRFRGDGIALMCHGPRGLEDEWILLCPDDTAKRIEQESKRYRDVAFELTFRGLMDSNWQNELLENLYTLTPGTRCANTLEHEYGHVLQHRMWASESIDPRDQASLYKWFVDIGYAQNVSIRIPKFVDQPDDHKLYLLKEAFVEDYRIGLNLTSNQAIFELPNAYCFRRDFMEPTLLTEGVSLVKQVISEKKTDRKEHYVHEYEPDRVAVADWIMSLADDFIPSRSQMTLQDHLAVVERLQAKSKSQQI